MAPAAGFRRNMGRFASCAIGISERWSFRCARQLDDALGRLDPNGVPAGVAAAVQTIRERKHARLLRALADGAVTTAVGTRVSPTAASTRCTSSFPARAGRRECHRRHGPGRWPPTTRCRESPATAWQTGSAAARSRARSRPRRRGSPRPGTPPARCRARAAAPPATPNPAAPEPPALPSALRTAGQAMLPQQTPQGIDARRSRGHPLLANPVQGNPASVLTRVNRCEAGAVSAALRAW